MFKHLPNFGIHISAVAFGLFLTAQAMSADVSPARFVKARGNKGIPNRYIVLYKEGAESDSLVAAAGDAFRSGRIRHRFRNVVKGYAAELSQQELQGVLADPNVALVEEDAEIKIESDAGASIGADTEQPSDPAASLPWGLDRIDQQHLPLDASFMPPGTGQGVHVYIIDTGILSTHTDFGGRASLDFSSIQGEDPTDCHGHGTHVAGTVGGTRFGVAKNVSLHAVKVMNCTGNGSVSSLISGIDWVAQNHLSPAVVNMSIQAGYTEAGNQAVAALAAKGVLAVVAAGNYGQNACSYSPASAPAALAVGATDSSDQMAGFSNRGGCVRIFAPGVSVESDYYTSNSATAVLSGTSMASPHTAGVAALYLQGHPTASPAQLTQALIQSGVKGEVGGLGTDSPNLLVQTPTQSPVAPGSCTNCKLITWSILKQGTSILVPGSTYKGFAKGAWLKGPPGVEFNLVLQMAKNNKWVNVATGAKPGVSEQYVQFPLKKRRRFRLLVSAVGGPGAFSLWYRTTK